MIHRNKSNRGGFDLFAIEKCHVSELLDELLHRKEVIQPQVPLRLPCYDFIPVTTYTLGPS